MAASKALALSATVIGPEDPGAELVVFTAYHLIERHEKLTTSVREGFAFVEANPRTLLAFGLSPTYAAAGYGYLELGGPLGGRAREVKRFREKSDRAAARSFLPGLPQ
jgi:mannose-1-phosphate guanylyltransferase